MNLNKYPKTHFHVNRFFPCLDLELNQRCVHFCIIKCIHYFFKASKLKYQDCKMHIAFSMHRQV